MKNIYSWFGNRFNQWPSLRDIQNNKIVKSTYIWLIIVPFFAKAFSRMEDIFKFEISGKSYEIDLTLPFSWQLFFFSALFFVIGNLIFFIRAPEFFKEFRNYGDFAISGQTKKHLYAYKTDALRTHERNETAEEQDYNRTLELAGLPPKETKTNYVEDEKNLFWKINEFAKKENPKSKFACAMCYCIGLLLFGIVAIRNLIWVLDQVI